MFQSAQKYFQDPAVRFFHHDERHDITASDCPTVGSGRFIVATVEPDPGNIVIIKAMMPYCMQRTAVGNALTESAVMLSPPGPNGFISFEPRLETGVPFQSSLHYNAPTTAAAASDAFLQQTSGIGSISDRPWLDGLRAMENSYFHLVVPSNRRLQVIFSVLAAAATSPIPNPWTIGGGEDNSIDFAGVVLLGVQMASQHYDAQMRAARGGM